MTSAANEKRGDEPRSNESAPSNQPREIVNPGDPGPNVLVPPKTADPRLPDELPPMKKPPAGV